VDKAHSSPKIATRITPQILSSTTASFCPLSKFELVFQFDKGTNDSEAAPKVYYCFPLNLKLYLHIGPQIYPSLCPETESHFQFELLGAASVNAQGIFFCTVSNNLFDEKHSSYRSTVAFFYLEVSRSILVHSQIELTHSTYNSDPKEYV